jgi:hypothetical protein
MEFFQTVLDHVDANLSIVVATLWVGILAALLLSLVSIRLSRRLTTRLDGVFEILDRLHRYEQARLLREREQVRSLKGSGGQHDGAEFASRLETSRRAAGPQRSSPSGGTNDAVSQLEQAIAKIVRERPAA